MTIGQSVGVRTDDDDGGGGGEGGWRGQIDDRFPLVKYYQASFFPCIGRPPSTPPPPGITQRMVRCGQLMICPPEPFTFFVLSYLLTIEPVSSLRLHNTDGLGRHSDCRALFISAQSPSVPFIFTLESFVTDGGLRFLALLQKCRI